MNIYFSCSITGGRDQQTTYAQIVKKLIALGHEVPTAHLASEDVFEQEINADEVAVYQRDIGWVRRCDALIAEVSTPSHGVGYEIAAALYEKKPVLCCYRKGKSISKMITGNREPGMRVIGYGSENELMAAILIFLNEIT